MKFGLNVEDVKRINRTLGGNLRDKGSIEFAIATGEGKPDIRKVALLWRAVLIDHPFDDANKRTVELITRKYARMKKYEIDTEKLTREILNVSKKNITNLSKIERRIKYATKGN